MARFFIHRPVFAWVIALITMLVGALGLNSLAIEQYPQIAPTTVQVRATYNGASAEIVESSVTTVIEDAMTGIDGLTYMTSNSTPGSASVALTFDDTVDPDIAQVQVQNKLQLATPLLPQEVQQQGVQVERSTSSILLVAALTAEEGTYTTVQLGDLISQFIEDPVKRTPGVGSINTFGSGYAMRVWMDPMKMVQYSVTPADVTAAVAAQNTNVTVGDLGAQPAAEGQRLTVSVTAQSQLSTVEEFESILLRVDPDGSTVFLGDVARIEIGQESYGGSSRYNGNIPAAAFAVNLATGANAVSTAAAVRDTIDSLADALPAGVEITYPYDTSPFVEKSISQVYKTLAEAVVLVFLVILVFLQSWRATIIPVVAIPVVLLGTFAVLAVAGFSINTLTMFALVLAIGLLVDDAIVVVENVERVMEEEGLGPVEATEKSMDEITSALVGIVLVLSAVFLPMAFQTGATGVIYRQFSITIITAMTLSLGVAVIPDPRHVRQPAAPAQAWRRHRSGTLVQPQPGPDHDRLCRHRHAAGEAPAADADRPGRDRVRRDDAVRPPARIVPARRGSGRRPGHHPGPGRIDHPADAGPGRKGRAVPADPGNRHGGIGLCRAWLQLRRDRAKQRAGLHQAARLCRTRRVRHRVAGEPGERLFLHHQPPGPDLCPAAARDPGPGHVLRLYHVPGGPDGSGPGRAGRRRQPACRRCAGGWPGHQPARQRDRQHPDRPAPGHRSAEGRRPSGLNIGDVNAMLSVIFAGRDVNDFALGNDLRPVVVQGEAASRSQPEDIERWYARNSQGEMVSFGAFADQSWQQEPQSLARFGGTRALELSGAAVPGLSSGEAMDVMEQMVADMDGGYGTAWTGLSFQERLSGNQAPLLFALSALVVFLSLAALYESWSVPIAVMMTVPVGILGALAAALFFGQSNDVYFKVGLLTTIGLAARNAILIVEFAEAQVKEGKTVVEAALIASRQRLRPILMTTFAFMLGVLPLAIASGAGAGAQNSIGIGVLGGMASSAVIGIFLVPVFYVAVLKIRSLLSRKKEKTS